MDDAAAKTGGGKSLETFAARGASRIAIPAESIARAIAYAIEQPNDVDVSELVGRPTASPF